MLETAAFDPIWTEFNWDREGRCTVPCIRDYSAVFKGKIGGIKDEWESYDGPQLERIDLKDASRKELTMRVNSTESKRGEENVPSSAAAPTPYHGGKPEHPDSFQPTLDEEVELRNAGVVANYVLSEDKFPPTNRTLENFFRGAWTYHIHNQVSPFLSIHSSHVFATATPLSASSSPSLRLAAWQRRVRRVAQPHTFHRSPNHQRIG
jgi:hypothetical protein